MDPRPTDGDHATPRKKRRKLPGWINKRLFMLSNEHPSLTRPEEALTLTDSPGACPSPLPAAPVNERDQHPSGEYTYHASCKCRGPTEAGWFTTSCHTSSLLRYYTRCLRAIYSTSFNTRVARRIKDRNIDFAPINTAITTQFSETISSGLAPFTAYTFGCYLLCRGAGSFPSPKVIRASKIGALDWGPEFLDLSPTLSNLTPWGSRRWAMSAEGFTHEACALAYHIMCAGRLGDDLYSDYECPFYTFSSQLFHKSNSHLHPARLPR